MADFEKNHTDVQSSASPLNTEHLLNEVKVLRDRLTHLEQAFFGQGDSKEGAKDNTERAVTQRNLNVTANADFNLLNLDKLFNRH